MSDQLQNRIIEHLKSAKYQPQRPRKLAQQLDVHQEESYHEFRDTLSELIEPGKKRLVVSRAKGGTAGLAPPDANPPPDPTPPPDAAHRHIKPGTKVVIELTTYPDNGEPAQGVITQVLGKAGEKDVDLK